MWLLLRMSCWSSGCLSTVSRNLGDCCCSGDRVSDKGEEEIKQSGWRQELPHLEISTAISIGPTKNKRLEARVMETRPKQEKHYKTILGGCSFGNTFTNQQRITHTCAKSRRRLTHVDICLHSAPTVCQSSSWASDCPGLKLCLCFSRTVMLCSIDLMAYLNRSAGGEKALSLAGNIETTVSESEVFDIPNNLSVSKVIRHSMNTSPSR